MTLKSSSLLSIVKNLSNKEMILDVIGEQNFDEGPTYAPGSYIPH